VALITLSVFSPTSRSLRESHSLRPDTRRGKKGSFEYIQKHPFDPEDAVPAVKGAKGK
jgi:hypothetical protein